MSELLKAGIWCYHNTKMSQSGLWRLEHNGGRQNAGMLTEGMTVLGWVRGSGYIQYQQVVRENEWRPHVMHAVSLYGNASGAVHEDALTSAWKHDPRVCYNRGFIVGSYTLPTYYFALQQSWKGVRESGVWVERLQRPAARKQTSRKEGVGEGVKSSTATFIVFKGLQRAAGTEQMS